MVLPEIRHCISLDRDRHRRPKAHQEQEFPPCTIFGARWMGHPPRQSHGRSIQSDQIPKGRPPVATELPRNAGSGSVIGDRALAARELPQTGTFMARQQVLSLGSTSRIRGPRPAISDRPAQPGAPTGLVIRPGRRRRMMCLSRRCHRKPGPNRGRS